MVRVGEVCQSSKEGRRYGGGFLCEFLLAPPSLKFSSLTSHHLYSIPTSPPQHHFVGWNGTWGGGEEEEEERMGLEL
jgi:hypothetical protein